MKTERSMGTLITMFSGLAALLCLLSGLQLFSLESQIDQAGDKGSVNSGPQLRNWKAQAHHGAVMSLGAGVLIFLFGLRHHATTVQAGKRPAGGEDPYPSSIDPESLTIRVFESDEDDRYVEVSDESDNSGWSEPPPTAPVPSPSPRKPAVDLEYDVEPEADPTDTIVESIHKAVAPGDAPQSGTGPKKAHLSFWGRFFSRRRP